MSAPRAPRRPNPFVGPRPFQPGEPLFGRDREIGVLRNLLVAERIVALYSPSGAGKTSLVQAGLIPQLREAEFHVLPVIRVNQPPPENGGAGVNRYIDSALRSLEQGLTPGEQQPPESLHGLRLIEYLSTRPRPPDAPATDLLIFDQFEEILTLDPTDAEAKTEFFTQVGEALRSEERWALFSFREDHLAGLDRFLPLLPTRLATTFRLEFLSPEAAVQAMRGAAGVGGVAFAEDAARRLAADLSQVRMPAPGGAVEERPGPTVEPVQLQVVCHRLWNLLPDDGDEIDLTLVEAHGDVSDALGAFYAESVAEVATKTNVAEGAIRAWFDENLITRQGIRGQVLWEQGQGAGLGDAAIGALIDTHLVRAESRRGASWLELAHDRLIDPVRADNDAWYQAHLSPLQQQAKIWQSQGREPGFLLTGEALIQAEQWAAEHAGELSGNDRAFLADSRDQRRLQDAERRELETAQRLAQAEESARHEAEERIVEQAAAAVSLRRWLWVAGVAAILALVALAVAGVSYWNLKFATDEAEQANRLAAESAQRLTISELTSDAASQLDDGQHELSALLARQAFLFGEEAGQPAPAMTDKALRDVLSAPYYRRDLGDGAVLPVQAASSGDGQTLAVASQDGAVWLWRLDDPPPVAPTRLTARGDPTLALAIDAGGRWLALEELDGDVALWDLGAAEPVKTRALDGSNAEMTALAFSGESRFLAAAGEEGALRLWDLGAPESTPPGSAAEPASTIVAMAFQPDGRALATAGYDGTAQLWPISDRGVIGEPSPLPAADSAVTTLAFSPDGLTLVGGGEDGSLRLWTPGATDAVPTLVARQGPAIRAAAFSADGVSLAAGDEAGVVRLWPMRDPGFPLPTVLDGPGAAVLAVAVDAGSGAVVAASANGTVQEWTPADRRLIPPPLGAADGGVSHLSFGRHGRSLAISSFFERTRLWNLTEPSSPMLAAPLPSDAAWSLTAAYSPDGTILATADATATGQIRLWDMTNPDPTELEPLVGHEGRVFDLGFSEDGRLLVSASSDGTARVWNLADRTREPVVLSGEETPAADVLAGVAISPDGRTVAAASRGGEVLVWNAADPAAAKTPASLTGHDGSVFAVAFSPDGARLASGGQDGTVRLWKTGDPGAEPDVLFGLEDEIYAVAFSPDGRYLAAGGRNLSPALDATPAIIRLWDLTNVDTFEAPVLFTGHTGPVSAVAFSPDGRFLATGSHDGTTRLWLVDARELSEAVCTRAGRSLTEAEWRGFVGADRPYRATCAGLPDGKLFEARARAQAGDGAGAAAAYADAAALAAATRNAAINDALCGRAVEDGFAAIALPACERAAALAPQVVDYRYHLALALAANGETARIVSDAASQDAQLNSDICRRGLVSGEADVVLAICERAVELAPQIARYRHTLAQARFALGDAPGATAAVVTDNASLNDQICQLGLEEGSALVVLPTCERAAELAGSNARYRFNLGLARAAAGQPDAAVEAISAAVRLAAATDDAALNSEFCLRGRVQNHAAEVLPACEQAVSLTPDNAGAYYALILAQTAAEDAAEPPAVFSPDNAALNNEICWLGVGDLRPEAVLPACDRAVELTPDDVEYQYTRFRALAAVGDQARLAAAAAALGADLSHRVCQRGLDGDILAVLPACERAAEMEPSNAVNRFDLAAARLATEDDAGAAAAVTVDDAALSGDICQLGLNLGRADIALPACEQAIALAPENSGYRYRLGLARQALDDGDGAQREFAAAIELATAAEDASVGADLCGLGLEDRRADVVLPACEQAAALEPQNGAYAYALALAKREAGDPEAGAALERAADLAAASGDARLNGDICRLGISDETIGTVLTSCQRAAELAPGNGEYLFDLGLAHEAAGDRAGALDVFTRAGILMAESDDANLNNEYCWNRTLFAFPDAAMPACERAVALAPDDGGIRDSRGLARALTGDAAGAIADFTFFLSRAEAEGHSEELIADREGWIAELEEGRNPFGAEMLAELALVYYDPTFNPFPSPAGAGTVLSPVEVQADARDVTPVAATPEAEATPGGG